MANHAFARLSKPIDPAIFTTAFETVNESRFERIFAVTHEEQDDSNYWTFEPTVARGLLAFMFELHPGNRKLEWRHVGFDMIWWAQEFAASTVLAGLGCKVTITDEGIDDKMKPTYHVKYPLYSDWFNGMNKSLRLPLVPMRWAHDTPEVIRRVFR